MRKLLRWGLVLGLVYVAATIYIEGADNAFGGAFSFLSRMSKAEAEEVLAKTSAYAESISDSGTRRSVPLTDSVRERVTGHMAEAAERVRHSDAGR